jgi:surfeit locus 1 family protein
MRAFLQQPLLTVKFSGWTFSPPRYAAVLALLVIAGFCRLALWQTHRAFEKDVMLERYAARAHTPPLPLSAVVAHGEDVADLPVQLRGHFDNSRTLFLDNQPQDRQSGFHVYTPFLPDGDTRFILVNRGWLARSQNASLLPLITAAAATEINGTLALPSAFYTVGSTDYQQRPLRVPRLEMDQLSAALGVELRPFVLRLDAAAPDGFSRKWSPAASLAMGPEKHRAYAFQWWALAAAVLVVFIVVNVHKTGVNSHE